MSESANTSLACIECGQPIATAGRWLCSARCGAVMALVRYGRRSQLDDLSPMEDDRLARYRRAADIVGRFPTELARKKVLDRDAHRCTLCGATGANEVDYVSGDPSVERGPQVGDLRSLCSPCHRSESIHRFVGERERIEPTAPASWARIEAAAPLVGRDNPELWDQRTLALLSKTPLMGPETRRDLELWAEAVKDAMAKAQDDPAESDPMATLVAALTGLDLPLRRQERVVRALHALALGAYLDLDSSEVPAEQAP